VKLASCWLSPSRNSPGCVLSDAPSRSWSERLPFRDLTAAFESCGAIASATIAVPRPANAGIKGERPATHQK